MAQNMEVYKTQKQKHLLPIFVGGVGRVGVVVVLPVVEAVLGVPFVAASGPGKIIARE